MFNPFKLLNWRKTILQQNNSDELKFYLRRIQLENQILNCTDSGITQKKYCDHQVIVSLTTYGRRINDVCFTIESLMQQTFKPNKILLSIDYSLIDAGLPETLRKQIERGLTILPTKDIRSYKKLIPALKTYPDEAIITVDDDVIYDFDLLERLIKSHIAAPQSIYAGRIHSMTFDDSGKLNPYDKWDWSTATNPQRNFITGVGGVIYPPHSLHPEVLNENVFTNICPTADDVWFTAMAKLNGTEIRKIQTRNIMGVDFVSNYEMEKEGLNKINTGKNGKNDGQIAAVFSKYGIYNLIK